MQGLMLCTQLAIDSYTGCAQAGSQHTACMDQTEKGQGPMDPPQSWLLCDSGQILCVSVPLCVSRPGICSLLAPGTAVRTAIAKGLQAFGDTMC